MDRPETRLTGTLCPHCGHLLDAATSAMAEGRPTPRPGDFSICIACAEILVFDLKLVPVKPTPGLLDRVAAQEPKLLAELRRAQTVMRGIIAERPGQGRGRVLH